MSRRRVLTAACSVALALLLAGCSPGSLGGEAAQRPEARPSLSLLEDVEGPPRSSIADVVERVLPSVVNVRVTSVELDPFGGAQQGEGQGSGVVIGGNGIILTNNHVVADAVDVRVVFNDDEHGSMRGEVIGTVPEKDLAVIKVDADDLTPIAIGDSDELRLGDRAIAIGFPLGLGGPTVTEGIISAKDRRITPGGRPGVDPVALEGLLQTDAAINPGNSGGALVDAAGRLIGINTAAASAGAAENIGFAIPIDDALVVANEILSEPREERAWLGVQPETVSSTVALQLGLPTDTTGALIVGVLPRSPAEEAGLEQGDVITSIESPGSDREIASADDLTEALTTMDPGETVTLEVLRRGDTISLEVTLGERPATFPLEE